MTVEIQMIDNIHRIMHIRHDLEVGKGEECHLLM